MERERLRIEAARAAQLAESSAGLEARILSMQEEHQSALGAADAREQEITRLRAKVAEAEAAAAEARQAAEQRPAPDHMVVPIQRPRPATKNGGDDDDLGWGDEEDEEEGGRGLSPANQVPAPAGASASAGGGEDLPKVVADLRRQNQTLKESVDKKVGCSSRSPGLAVVPASHATSRARATGGGGRCCQSSQDCGTGEEEPGAGVAGFSTGTWGGQRRGGGGGSKAREQMSPGGLPRQDPTGAACEAGLEIPDLSPSQTKNNAQAGKEEGGGAQRKLPRALSSGARLLGLLLRYRKGLLISYLVLLHGVVYFNFLSTRATASACAAKSSAAAGKVAAAL